MVGLHHVSIMKYNVLYGSCVFRASCKLTSFVSFTSPAMSLSLGIL